MKPLPAPAALAAYFLEARCKILDVAAILDRIQRGEGAEAIDSDPRWKQLKQGIEALLRQRAARAEEVQNIFSLAYDPNWKIPQPK